FMIREMHQRHSAYWQWTAPEWTDVLSGTPSRPPAYYATRPTVVDVAYLLCGFDDLCTLGRLDWVPMAHVLFGHDRVETQIRRLSQYLPGARGYGYRAATPAAIPWLSASRPGLPAHAAPRLAG